MPRRSNRTFPPARYPHADQPQSTGVDRRPRDFYDGSGSHLLGNHILPLVRIECPKCNRRGQYSTKKLLAKYGPHQQMVELRWLLTQCRRKDFNDYCGVFYADARWLSGATDEMVPPWPVPPRRATPAQLGRRWVEEPTPPQRLPH